MPKFAANLSWLFTELDFPDRFAAAADAGFKGVECLFPYEHDAADIARRLANHGLELVLINAPPGNWDGGERGLACLPGRQEEFRAALQTALDFAIRTGCRRVHVMAGLAPRDAAPFELQETYLENLNQAAEMCGQAGVRAMIEPINPVDMPGYYLSLPAQAAEFITNVASRHVGLQFDIYHAAMSGLDIADEIERHFPLIGHFQVAGMPGRGEPIGGPVDYTALFQLIDRLAYAGWIGCEYRPRGNTLAGLDWISVSRPASF